MQDYTSTDQQLHILSQVIAKANRTFVPSKEDDSHTNLGFDSLANRIVGHWIETPTGQCLLTLNLSNQNFEWINNKQDIVLSTETIGKTISEIQKEISSSLSVLELNPDGFIDDLHYEIPTYSFTGNPVQKMNKEDLVLWTHYRLLANEACGAILNYLSVSGEIRIWPHHFDTGIYVAANPNIGIGFGLAMEDQMAGAPYLYMSGYPSNGDLDFKNVKELPFGKWILSDYWNGAIITLEELDSFPRAGTTFIIEALNWYLKN